jgi:predicted sulfurtransferase
MPRHEDVSKRGDSIDTLCEHCGQTFSRFLHEMEEHNEKVVCPTCGKEHGAAPEGKKAKQPAKKG